MAEDFRTWRSLLGWVISDPQERHRIAAALDVSPITLGRWVTSSVKPRPERLQALVDAVPRYRQQFIGLISREFPDIFIHSASTQQFIEVIPSAFYARVLNINTNSPPILRASATCIAILQQILSHLDPQQQGMAIFIAQCVAPLPGHKVRSLRKTLGRGTEPWSSHLELWTQFFGAESLPGYALSSGHAMIMRDREDREQWASSLHSMFIASALACPILLNDSTPGSLYIISTQPEYFSQAHLEIIRSYADLLVLAFDPHEFYALWDVQLEVIPAYEAQVAAINRFQQRVKDVMILAMQEGWHMTRPQAEAQVWRELEDELIRLALNHEDSQDQPPAAGTYA